MHSTDIFPQYRLELHSTEGPFYRRSCCLSKYICSCSPFYHRLCHCKCLPANAFYSIIERSESNRFFWVWAMLSCSSTTAFSTELDELTFSAFNKLSIIIPPSSWVSVWDSSESVSFPLSEFWWHSFSRAGSPPFQCRDPRAVSWAWVHEDRAWTSQNQAARDILCCWLAEWLLPTTFK